jgi:catechol 2,3-dioxygenase-like lactoylglutathione lyase family enzyme
MRLGPIHAATVVVRNLDRALAAYAGQLGLVVTDRGRLPHQRGLDMGDAALADAACARLRWVVDVEPWLTLIEMPEATLSAPCARRGWTALGLLVADIENLAAQLDHTLWRVLGEPKVVPLAGGLREMQLAGADGEVLRLVQVMEASATSLPAIARCPVDRIFAVTLATRHCASALGFYAGLGLVAVGAPAEQGASSASAAAVPLARGQLRGGQRIEIEQRPLLPGADATLRSGIRMISFARSDAAGRRLAAHVDPSARILAGPEGEAIELL